MCEKVKVKKTRYSVTLTEPFKKGISELVKRGLFMDPQDVIRQSLRNTFEKHGIDPFSKHTKKEG